MAAIGIGGRKLKQAEKLLRQEIASREEMIKVQVLETDRLHGGSCFVACSRL
jgi:hypothetical protein